MIRSIKSAAQPSSAMPLPSANGDYEPDLDSAQQLVLELMAIPGTSGQETAVSAAISGRLEQAGIPAGSLRIDKAHEQTPLDGQTGNLILTLPGTLRGPRRLLMAHMDTVPLCVGAQPVVKGKSVRSANKQTGLGADDRGGCAVILTAALEILRRGLPHPPLTFLWAVQEEVGLYGARYVKLEDLSRPKLAFNWDGGDADKLAVGATGAYRLEIEILGLASHAGGAPEHGVSAITIAALAIAQLAGDGWLGDVRKGSRHGTSNVGAIQGGKATNVITDRVQLRAECRSHDAAFRKKLLAAFEQAFRRAAAKVKNVAGVAGKARIESRLDYDSFRLADDEPCVLAAEAAIRSAGGEPFRAITNGGLDANWLSARGIPTVTLGCGQVQVHTTSERLDLVEFRKACRVGLRLATACE